MDQEAPGSVPFAEGSTERLMAEYHDFLTPKKVPFTEDPIKQVLTNYSNFFESPDATRLCDHYRKNGPVYLMKDEFAIDEECSNIHLAPEETQRSEGKIEREDLEAFLCDVLKEDGQRLGGYWEVVGADNGTDGTEGQGSPLPVFQFGTLGLEIFPCENGVIRLGTLDVELMLMACLQYGKLHDTVPKLSGSATYGHQVMFQWFLRGPSLPIDRDSAPGGAFGRVIRGCASFFH